MRAKRRGRLIGRLKAKSVHKLSFCLAVLVLLSALGSCSSAPKEQLPKREISAAASEYAVFGNKFYRQGRLKEAEEMYLFSLEYYKRVDDRPGMVRAYNSLGKVYLAAGTVSRSEEAFAAAIQVVEGIEREGAVSAYELALLKAETYNNRGELALRKDDPQTALREFNRGIDLATKLDNPRELAVLLHNRGGVYKNRGEYEASQNDLERALELNEKADRFQEMATNHYMLSSLASQQKDYQTARAHGLNALRLDKKVENSLGIAQDLLALGHIARKTGNNETGAHYYLRAYRIYDSLALEDGKKKVIEYLREAGAVSLIDKETLGSPLTE
jgi:tetratricopeptide (TPR) repeat protein